MSERIELEPDYKRDGGTQSSSGTAYSVEVRTVGGRPIAFDKNRVFDSTWRQFFFDKCPEGCPGVPAYSREFPYLYDYAAANALRWWLHAVADGGCGSFLESRLVAHRVKVEQSSQPIFACDVVDRKLEFGPHP